MAKLTKEGRDALPADDFAVPGKRDLPMHDAHHVKMAWDSVSKTKDLSDGERKEARSRIIRKAKTLGIDTKDWEAGKLKASITLSAMALNISTSDHVNKMPFSGIMTRIDEPSDAPPEGSGGRLITISAEAAEKNLSSLLGMAVDYKSDFDGHDPQAKIGIITAATIEGNAIHIEGFIYAADFPEVAAEIKANKDKLGFSYECRDLYTHDPDANPCVIHSCTFTGAAILRKDKAAYRTTSIQASREDFEEMSPEEKKQLDDLTAGMSALTDSLKTISASVDSLKTAPKVEANANTMALVEPHAKACESCAASMEAAGIGGDPNNGHAVHLRKMAGHMRAEAALGRVPSAWHGGDRMWGSAEPVKVAEFDVSAKVADLLKPVADKLAAMGTQLADLKAKAFTDAPAPQRKTLDPAISGLMAKSGLEAPTDGSKISLEKLNAAMKELPVETRLKVKAGLSQAGLLD